MRNEVLKRIEEEKIIVIIRGVEKENLIPLAQALYDGGIHLMEITYSANGAVSDEQTAENISILSKHFEGRMFIGAGTVITTKQVELTKEAGGKFIISPDTCEEVIRATREMEMVSIPGALTPTEIANAHRYGSDFVKVFPVGNMGVSYIKNVVAPLSHIRLLAVGSVDGNNVADYLAAGAVGAGVSSCLFKKEWIKAGEWDKITEAAKTFVAKL